MLSGQAVCSSLLRSGRNSFTIRRAFHWLRNSFTITAKFFQMCFRSNPATGRPMIRYPASGTRCISIRPSAPTKRISASGRSSLTALAIDTAGKMCPPVPPPLIMTRGPLFFVSISCYLFTQIQHHYLILWLSVRQLSVCHCFLLRWLLSASVFARRALAVPLTGRCNGSRSISCQYRHS